MRRVVGALRALIKRMLSNPDVIAKYDLEDGAVRIPDDALLASSLLLDARWMKLSP